MWKVMWQYSSAVVDSIKSEQLPDVNTILADRQSLWSDLDTIGEAEPTFPKNLGEAKETVLRIPVLRNDPAMDLAGYFHIFVPTREQASILLGRLKADPNVRYAATQQKWENPVRFGHPEMIAAPPPLQPGQPTPNLVQEQGYLSPAPYGVDALYAWNILGGAGQDIAIVDVEHGWNFDHEDLRHHDFGLIHGSLYDDNHGTAVLGICHGDNNPIGVTGIAYESTLFTCNPNYDQTNKKWNAAAAIYDAARRLDAGDVILLEMHAPGPNSQDPNIQQQGYIAVEYWLHEFAAIKFASGKGIYVIEAAGNGGEDLDAPIYGDAFNRNVNDSGAIFVGAGYSALRPYPRSRIDWSNYGSRLDAHAWGLDIVTCGGRQKPYYYDRVDSPDPSRCYTQSFGGTSGASPIVTGVVACISGAVKAAGLPTLSPQDMRSLLSSTGSPQTDAPGFPASQRVGPMPDIKSALAQLFPTN